MAQHPDLVHSPATQRAADTAKGWCAVLQAQEQGAGKNQ